MLPLSFGEQPGQLKPIQIQQTLVRYQTSACGLRKVTALSAQFLSEDFKRWDDEVSPKRLPQEALSILLEVSGSFHCKLTWAFGHLFSGSSSLFSLVAGSASIFVAFNLGSKGALVWSEE